MLYQSLVHNYVYLVMLIAIIIIADIIVVYIILNRLKSNSSFRINSSGSSVIEQVFYNSENPLFIHKMKQGEEYEIVDFNHAVVDLLEEAPESKTLDDYFELADSSISLRQYFDSFGTSIKVIRIIVALKNAEDKSFDYELSIHAVPELNLSVATLRNVREEKALLNKYKDSQYALNLAMENGKIAVYEFDVEKTRFKCDDLWFKLHGVEHNFDGLSYSDFLRIIKVDDVESFILSKDKLVSGELDMVCSEYQVMIDGEWVWRKTTVKAKFRNNEGRALVLIGVSLDIDKEKKLNLRLNYLSRNFQLLMDNSPDYIYFKDSNYKFTMVSKSLENELSTNGTHSVIGFSDFDIYSFEDANNLFELEKRVIENGERVVNNEQFLNLPNGKALWTLATKIPLKSKEGDIVGLFGISKDITEYKQLSIELSNNQRLRSISRLAGGIAHDFNNSLNGIMGFAYLLENMFEKDSKGTEYVQHIIQSTEKCAELTRHLLAFARRGKYEVKVVDLHQIIKHAVTILSHSISKFVNVELKFEAENSVVKVDESQIENVIINIAGNADSAMEGEGTLTIRTKNENICKNTAYKVSSSSRFRKRDMGTCVTIEFVDTGIGIEEEVIERIFEPFFTTKPLGKGTGLGLAAVYGIVENHGGLVGVESTVGQGTTVRVCLPVVVNNGK